jgi:hypothetical protein
MIKIIIDEKEEMIVIEIKMNIEIEKNQEVSYMIEKVEILTI